jgi:hypothetical protein
MSAAESLKADPLKQVSSEGSNASSQLPVKDLEAPRPKSKDPGKPTSQSDPNQVKATDTPPPVSFYNTLLIIHLTLVAHERC